MTENTKLPFYIQDMDDCTAPPHFVLTDVFLQKHAQMSLDLNMELFLVHSALSVSQRGRQGQTRPSFPTSLFSSLPSAIRLLACQLNLPASLECCSLKREQPSPLAADVP